MTKHIDSDICIVLKILSNATSYLLNPFDSKTLRIFFTERRKEKVYFTNLYYNQTTFHTAKCSSLTIKDDKLGNL